MFKTKKECSVSKKSNKPLMEKKRRARINECLSQLKLLVLHAMKKEGNGLYSKLEKADILELTVKYLRQQRRQQIFASASSNPTVLSKYIAGYNECASEVQKFLAGVENVDIDTRTKLLNHLFNAANNMTEVSSPPPVQTKVVQVQRNDMHPAFVNQPTSNMYNVVSGMLPSGQITTFLLPVGSSKAVSESHENRSVNCTPPSSASSSDCECEDSDDSEKENMPIVDENNNKIVNEIERPEEMWRPW
ncbi:DgyrCDS6326 [Dimorphilus gyrociliatus]|uniref:DgyrCDS6326 n=1 Tax=Dimorphilus gyrociliatus TaxID=2664684 RepID=A0A7I8VMQ1_9ANNE|nr:DgyrCDS6326 [Dimorphilus gyrociliatus]